MLQELISYLKVILFHFLGIEVSFGYIPEESKSCPHSLCRGKHDGNYAVPQNKHSFVQCAGGVAYCQSCWPSILEFSEQCNQCLYNRNDDCVTTQIFKPATTLQCPDRCPFQDPDFSGNIADPNNDRHYIACWKGLTVSCIACPGQLKYNVKENLCRVEIEY